MLRPPPVSTRHGTLFPYTTLFLSRRELVGQLGARGRIVLVIGDAAGQALRDHPGFVGVVAHLAQRLGDMGGQRWIGGRVFIAAGGDDALDRKSTRLNSSHSCASRMPSSA